MESTIETETVTREATTQEAYHRREGERPYCPGPATILNLLTPRWVRCYVRAGFQVGQNVPTWNAYLWAASASSVDRDQRPQRRSTDFRDVPIDAS